MGNKDSYLKRSYDDQTDFDIPIKYEEAVEILTDSEFRRLETAWNNRRQMNEFEFCKEIFKNTKVPKNFQSLIYHKFCWDEEAITFETLVISIVILTKGDLAMKKKFLPEVNERFFNIFSNDSTMMDREVTLNHNLYEVLSGVTHFTEEEIGLLNSFFYDICTIQKNKMNFDKFKFISYDSNEDSHIDFKEFLCALSASCRGPPVERIKFILQMWDRDKDNNFNEETINNIYKELDIEEKNKTLKIKNGKVSLYDVICWANGIKEVENFLELIKQNSYICFGLPLQKNEEELLIIKGYKNSVKRKLNTEYYIISYKWWNKMINEMSKGTYEIEPISGGEYLIETNFPYEWMYIYEGRQMIGPILKENIVENVDYVAIDKALFLFLKKKYGIYDNEIKRYCNYDGIIDLYPPLVLIHCHKGYEKKPWFWSLYPKTLPIKVLKNDAQEGLEIDDPNAIRLWLMPEMILIDDEDISLEKFTNDRKFLKILLEIRNRDMSWPEEMIEFLNITNESSTLNNDGYFLSMPLVNRSVLSVEKKTSGIVGLANLGNSCYMNSVLQCLIRTDVITDYLIKRLDENVEDNSLTTAFGKFLCEVFARENNKFTPGELKRMITIKCPLFADQNQQDANEFLSCFLNTISEELANSNNEKGIVPDTTYLSDTPADLEWKKQLEREFSIITLKICGQLKSSLTCQSCFNVSETFEPFTFLQLPIPDNELLLLTIILVPQNGKTPIRMSWSLPGHVKLPYIKSLIKNKTGIIETSIFFAILDSNFKLKQNIFEKLNNENVEVKSLCSLKECNIIAFEIVPESTDSCPVFALNRNDHFNDIYIIKAIDGITSFFFGMPLVFQYKPLITKVSDFYKDVYNRLSQYYLKDGNKNSTHNRAIDASEDLKGRYPFEIVAVDNSFEWCAICDWTKFCRGCNLEDLGEFVSTDIRNIAIHWKPSSLYLNYQSVMDLMCTDDESVEKEKEEYRKPMTV
ncbi:Ubiquitin carboxyl-terminal hydrolase 32 [Strongyloides ratti]|uniref:ubiquitinyl hydrolase 1 n=1 Tax=Strongyloides ratti TaxID=34506 RepID=A0A090MXJ5_STRRB|nr:Ubiquitin carboxyl-terminal hydrolase 32 [Strongyloides ratti]CEF65544.1 Ubiquitin carboxyl-terminal hydrolase 32 [Strongyloides ratti]